MRPPPVDDSTGALKRASGSRELGTDKADASVRLRKLRIVAGSGSVLALSIFLILDFAINAQWLAFGALCLVAAIVVLALLLFYKLAASSQHGRSGANIMQRGRSAGLVSPTSYLAIALLLALPIAGISYMAASPLRTRAPAPVPGSALSHIDTTSDSPTASVPPHLEVSIRATAPACGYATAWSPSSSSETDDIGLQASGTIAVPITVTVRESEDGLIVQVCKDDDVFMNDIALSIYDGATDGKVGVAATLRTAGMKCSMWTAIDEAAGHRYAEGQAFGGIWQVVSPAASAGDWNWPSGNCMAQQGKSGTCYSGIKITLRRTCK